jgi:hypothetical protein
MNEVKAMKRIEWDKIHIHDKNQRISTEDTKFNEDTKGWKVCIG